MTVHGAALDILAEADKRLRGTHGVLKSLCPTRAEATPLVVIGERTLSGAVLREVGALFAAALVRIAEAQSRNFPQNLFWDLDYPATRLLNVVITAAEAPSDAAARLDRAAELVEALEARYGICSPLRFQYVHDFVYGFDWARWVKRAPGERAAVGPFEPEFLEYLLRRAEQIEALIEEDDAKYRKLADGQVRNPFGFSREPHDEERLHRELAAQGLIPVEAWREDALPRWDRPFTELRAERAKQLGLSRKP